MRRALMTAPHWWRAAPPRLRHCSHPAERFNESPEPRSTLLKGLASQTSRCSDRILAERFNRALTIAGIFGQHSFQTAKVLWIIIGSALVHQKSVLVRHTTNGRAPAPKRASVDERESQRVGSGYTGARASPASTNWLGSPEALQPRDHMCRGPSSVCSLLLQTERLGTDRRTSRHAPSPLPLPFTANQETFLAI
jgi:hypothetical protein